MNPEVSPTLRFSSIGSNCSFGIRSAFSPYKTAKNQYLGSQAASTSILAYSQVNNISRYQGWPALHNTMVCPEVQNQGCFGNADYQSAEYYEDRLMRNENARRRRKAEKKREEAMRDRIHILEYENDQMRQEIEYLRLKLRTIGAQEDKSM